MSAKTDQPAPVPRFSCAECGLAVIVIGEHKIRACKHDAPILAAMSSGLTGAGGVRIS